MFVFTVIPISRGIGKESLSYFSAKSVELGSLVQVPLRNKHIDALVVNVCNAKDMKAEIKSADFTLRRVDELVSKPFLSEIFMKTVEDTARFHAATNGATLKILLPKIVFSHFIEQTQEKIDTKTIDKKIIDKRNGNKTKTVLGNLKQRIEIYKEEISEQSCVIVVPTKERQQLFKKIFPEVLVVLPSCMALIPVNISQIIIEDEKSPVFKGIGRPFIDFRFSLRKYAEYCGANILVGYETLDISVSKYIEANKKEDDRPLTSIGKQLEKDLKSLKENGGGRLFILGTRKGHSGSVVCQDCGLLIKCERCDSPLTLHLKNTKEDFNNLLCHHCGFKTTALTKCSGCGSWKLKAYGFGIEKIEEDIKIFCKKNLIPAYIQRIDSGLKLSPKKIRDFIKTHYEKETAILIATEIALPYLVEATLSGEKNDSSYVASLDSLLSLPDFSINEKVWRLCCFLDEISKEKVVIQTRAIKHGLLKCWEKNEEKEFWKQEMEERKAFNYPPHGIFIKITVKGKKDKIKKEMSGIEDSIRKWKPIIFPAFIKAINNQHILHALIVLRKDQWVDEDLHKILVSLSPSVTVEVNPRSLL